MTDINNNNDSASIEVSLGTTPVIPTSVPENTQTKPDEGISNHDVLGFLKDTDLLKSPTSQKFVGKSADDLMRSYINLEQVMGKKVAQYSVDEIKAINELRGVPKSVDEYQMPDGVSDTEAKWFKEAALKAGLSKNDALELVASYREREEAVKVDIANKALETNKQELETLRKMYGSAYEQRIALANQAAEQLGGKGLLEALVNAGLGANPIVIDALSKAGMMMSESKIPSSKHNQAFGISKEDAKHQIKLTLADAELSKAYYDRYNPKHKIVADDMRKLYEIAYNE